MKDIKKGKYEISTIPQIPIDKYMQKIKYLSAIMSFRPPAPTASALLLSLVYYVPRVRVERKSGVGVQRWRRQAVYAMVRG